MTYRTEVIKNELNPVWKRITVSASQLCNGDYDRNLKIDCHDWNKSGDHEIIGSCYTTLRELSRGRGVELEVSEFNLLTGKNF